RRARPQRQIHRGLMNKMQFSMRQLAMVMEQVEEEEDFKESVAHAEESTDLVSSLLGSWIGCTRLSSAQWARSLLSAGRGTRTTRRSGKRDWISRKSNARSPPTGPRPS